MPIAWHLSGWNEYMSIDDTKGIERLCNDESILTKEDVMKKIK